MRAFDNGPYYAFKLINNVLNTQGGPRRNSNAEILDANQNPIPHLYGAGELGGICANEYQGGGNLAECLIFGKIAGENAAALKSNENIDTDVNSGASIHQNSSNDLIIKHSSEIHVDSNQYIGYSDNGIGGEIAVRITYINNKLINIEILDQHETGQVGGKAIAELPAKMVKENTYDVDAISGATVSSSAIKAAVKNAISKANSK